MHGPFRRLLAVGFLAMLLPLGQASFNGWSSKPRTIFTTDMEQDDLASMIRYLLYSNEIDNLGIIYTASRYHWAGDGKGTTFYLPNRGYTTPQTSWRWTGNTTIQDIVLPAYAEVYPNLRNHDPNYPTADELLSIVKLGNIDFEGEMSKDTDGSNLIRSLLLDNDTRPLYLQTWGGTNTIARALKSIEDQYVGSAQWAETKAAISRKAVLLASGFQDTTYADYIAPNWPQLRVEQLAAGYATWGYNCNKGQGNLRGLPDAHLYFTGAWIKPYIETGPYGRLYRSWLDGQHMQGDPLDTFGNLTAALASNSSCRPLGPYDFLSEGDNVAYNGLLNIGIQDPSNLNLGSWGGRLQQNSTSPDLWVPVSSELAPNGTNVTGYTTSRWMAPAQNDFGARMHWTLTPNYRDGNHPPSVQILNRGPVNTGAGSTVTLFARVSDPDGNVVTTSWWQYLEEGTYPGTVEVTASGTGQATVVVPADAVAGQTISIILQGTDNGQFPLTRYDRIFIQVV